MAFWGIRSRSKGPTCLRIRSTEREAPPLTSTAKKPAASRCGATRTVVMPSKWRHPILYIDYSCMSKEETAECNTFLAENGLSFVDCLSVGQEYAGIFNGKECMVAKYVYPEKKR